MAARDEDAHQAIVRHHAGLVGGFRSRVAALAQAVATGGPYQGDKADLVAYLADEILTHAAAEEHSLYPAAAAAGLAKQVGAMVAEHRQLEADVDALVHSADGPETAARAEALAALFAAHVTAENDVVLPVLLAAEGTSLADLLSVMHDDYTAARGRTGATT